ncbi:cation diffusion facilitator family transporter [Clostridium magnum]|uniref:Ferrous-iron efflux pump FieF n=1 Tax=Clostridium magnum DSM 2767 TaxID=1121326 RepID=A0A162SQT8_9CLOT|nr:cation diffusion facilitator family transporter [Clostridium magnum]KZL91747.1 ferrous-iron efflux pump FieF [Clostridium magnum DSM 2767]SHJ03251.1 cation diffusion facilitator family transporter [Clostridium magnum DSM 2767]
MVSSNRKVKVAALSIVSNTTLIILKVVAGLLSGSVSIVSEAIHSGMDLVASIIAFLSVRVSSRPADEEHPYGHGKIENISGLAEGLLIFIAAFLIIKESVIKLSHPAEIEETGMAIVAMFISAVVNIIVSRILYKVAKEEDSLALEADALHLKTDVYTSLGVGIGLVLIKFTGISILDPIVAIAVACLIVKEAWHLCKSALNPLLDTRLSNEEEQEIKEVIEIYKTEVINFHKLKTRKSGNIRHIDFHMTVNEALTAKDSHKLIKKIEKDLEEKIKNIHVTVHIDHN